MPPELHVWNGERAHLGRWRELDGVGVIVPPPGTASPSAAFVEHCCELLNDRGYRVAVTPALSPSELLPFLQAGFHSREQLYVLVHHLDRPVPDAIPRGIALVRARAVDIAPCLDVDAEAFDSFWRFDRDALNEACAATPQVRFRVAITETPLRLRTPGAAPLPAGTVVGYCIYGRSRTQGFLQRLAVAPAAWGLGIGRALVNDGLGWLVRRRTRTCIVNTQESNQRAADLYVSCGFEMSTSGLFVLTRALSSDVLA